MSDFLDGAFAPPRKEGVVVIEVRVRKGENLDEALERFGRKLAANGLMQDILRHLYYQKPSAVLRMKSKRQGRIVRRF